MSNFIKPSPSPVLISLMQKAWSLYSKFKLGNLHFVQSDNLLDLFSGLKGQHIIICPNHPSIQDAAVLFGLSGIVNERFAFLTAREMFGRSNSFGAWWLQKLGCFSVERGGTDIEAFKACCHLLKLGQNKLVIFPEGEISYQNHCIREFANGPEIIAISTLHELQNSGSAASIKILPLALNYKYSVDINEHLLKIMEQVEKRVGVENGIHSLTHRIRRAFEFVFAAMKKEEQVEYGGAQAGLEYHLSLLAKNLISEVQVFTSKEFSLELSHLERIHLLITQLTRMLYGKKHEQASWFRSPRKRFFAKFYLRKLRRMLRLLTVGEQSFDHTLTQEEAAEMLSILAQEVGGNISVKMPDIVEVAAGEIIDVQEFMPEHPSDKKKCVEELKQELERRIISRLSQMDQGSGAHMLSFVA